jgi:hypothetical protein
LSFQNNLLIPSENCRNLGVIFYSSLLFTKHISNICRSSFHQIRQLRQIRSSLDSNSAIVLANALVSAKLDYCNSLYYNLPDYSLKRLQLVQNALARVVVPSAKRNQHISPTLSKLHWLPIKKRITLKIASITYKTLHFNEPSYLFNLLTFENNSRNLRSSNTRRLHVPLIKNVQLVDPFLLLHPLCGILCHLTFAVSLPFHLFMLVLKLIYFLLEFLPYPNDYLEFFDLEPFFDPSLCYLICFCTLLGGAVCADSCSFESAPGAIFYSEMGVKLD